MLALMLLLRNILFYTLPLTLGCVLCFLDLAWKLEVNSSDCIYPTVRGLVETLGNIPKVALI